MPDIIDLGSVRDRNTIELATSKRHRIPNAQRPESLPDALADAMRWITQSHPTVRLRSLTATYNCVGMAFANRRTWVEPDHVQMILADDEYKEVDLRDVLPGDVVVYHDGDGSISHVAVVVAHVPDVENARWRTTVLSQWGSNGEYLHDPNDVNELLGRPYKFYTERRRARE